MRVSVSQNVYEAPTVFKVIVAKKKSHIAVEVIRLGSTLRNPTKRNSICFVLVLRKGSGTLHLAKKLMVIAVVMVTVMVMVNRWW